MLDKSYDFDKGRSGKTKLPDESGNDISDQGGSYMLDSGYPQRKTRKVRRTSFKASDMRRTTIN